MGDLGGSCGLHVCYNTSQSIAIVKQNLGQCIVMCIYVRNCELQLVTISKRFRPHATIFHDLSCVRLLYLFV